MFDNVTLQFCMHYAFDSVQRARQMLENVAMYLRSGGVFIGTIPDADNILCVLLSFFDLPLGKKPGILTPLLSSIHVAQRPTARASWRRTHIRQFGVSLDI